MYKLLRKYIELNAEKLGYIVKMSMLYSEGKDIKESGADEDMQMFFISYIQKDIDRLIKERQRKKRARKEK